jgi:hypothetical protein
MVGPHCVLGKALARRLEQIRRHLKVALGRSDIEVTQVRGELWKQSLNVLAGAIPCEHPMHGRCVTNVMQPWGAWFADGAIDSGGSADMLEPRNDPGIAPGSAIARRE